MTSRSISSRAWRWARARLSIVDLAGGRQPIANEDGTIWVTQNGEIFEYPELQAELVARGHRLATRCDTELWVHLYEDLGEDDVPQDPRPVRRRALGPQVTVLDPRPRPGGDLPAVLRRGQRLAALGLGDQGPALLGDGRRAAGPDGHRPVLPHVLRRDIAHVLRGRPLDPARAIPARPGRPGRAEDLLGPRLPRRRPGAPAGRPDPAGRRARSPDAAVGREAVAGRRAGGVATSAAGWIRRSCWGSARASGVRGAVVHDRAGPRRPGRAVARRRVGRRAGLAADHRDDEPPRHRRRLSGADPRRRGPGDGLLLRLPDAAGRRRARAGLQGRADRRGRRRGAGRLCLVQDPGHPRAAQPDVALLRQPGGPESRAGVDARQPGARADAAGDSRRAAPRSRTSTT